MKMKNLIEFVNAASLTPSIESDFPQPGMLLLVSPPGAMKTTAIQIALAGAPDALVLTDVTTRGLNDMRSYFSGVKPRYRTLGLPDFDKLFQRNQTITANILGNLRNLCHDGFSHMNHEDQTMCVAKAKALVIAACTQRTYEQNYIDWKDGGLGRRMLRVSFTLGAYEETMEAAAADRRVPFNEQLIRQFPARTKVPLTAAEEDLVKKQAKAQGPDAVILARKIYCVLKAAKGAKCGQQIFRDAMTGAGAEPATLFF